jgi:glycosyltransferase involved in cell wall biosynthesis
MKSEVQRLFGLPFEKISIVPNGINLDIYDGIERDYEFRRRYARDNEKIIMCAGRLVYEKGFQYLLDAAPKILNGYNDVKFIIAGKGGMLNELKAKADFLGISDKVYFTGQLKSQELYRMYKCADVAVFPSTYEPFGIVAIEGMYAGTPIVVSDVGGLNEIVEHGVTGMKSYAGNANSIADSILTLLFNKELCDNIANNAKQKVKNKYNWGKIAQDTHFIYQKAICETITSSQQKQLKQEKERKTSILKQSNLIKFIRQEESYA